MMMVCGKLVILRKIYLDDCEESIIIPSHYNNIILLSSKRSNIEKSKIIDKQLKEEKMKKFEEERIKLKETMLKQSNLTKEEINDINFGLGNLFD